MGQRSWVWGCALLALLGMEKPLSGQEAPAKNPVAAVEQAIELTAPSERTAAAVSRAGSPAEAERRIEDVLAKPLRQHLAFNQQPLSQVAAVLSEQYQIPIQFDVAALDAAAASPDVEVTINIANVTLKTALRLMLKNAGAEQLTYLVADEVLLITTQEEAEKRLEVRVYRVDDLVVADGTQSLLDGGADYDTLIDIVTSSIEHESWMENGTGEGTISPFIPGMLVIANTRAVQQQIEQLFDTLRQTKAAVESDGKTASSERAKRPATRGYRIDDESIAATPESRQVLEDALKKSVDWQEIPEGVAADDLFLHVLPQRVIVRHVPRVLAQVDRAMDSMVGAPRTGVVGYAHAEAQASPKTQRRSGGQGGGGGGGFGGRGSGVF